MIAFHSKTVDVFALGSAVSCVVEGRHSNLFKCRVLAGTRLVFLCLLLVIYSQNPLSLYGIHLYLKRCLNVKCPGVYKKVVPGHFQTDSVIHHGY